ncbi:MAG: hypothetical protein M3O34_03275 [Chloroflexota bacterium]|nr:hypothetical protein [Chloroflexota bacterium]
MGGDRRERARISSGDAAHGDDRADGGQAGNGSRRPRFYLNLPLVTHNPRDFHAIDRLLVISESPASW